MRIVTDFKHAQQIIIELDARIAKLEADATCWTHGMNKEGTTGGMYLKANFQTVLPTLPSRRKNETEKNEGS